MPNRFLMLIVIIFVVGPVMTSAMELMSYTFQQIYFKISAVVLIGVAIERFYHWRIKNPK